MRCLLAARATTSEWGQKQTSLNPRSFVCLPPKTDMVLVQIGICAYITLVANYTMERDLRRAYLFGLRDRLRHAQADAASWRDALTGLANRHHLEAELRSLWEMPDDDVSHEVLPPTPGLHESTRRGGFQQCTDLIPKKGTLGCQAKAKQPSRMPQAEQRRSEFG